MSSDHCLDAGIAYLRTTYPNQTTQPTPTMTTTMTEKEKAAYAAGQDEMRERICALLHQHHYYLAVTYHGRGSEPALLVKNIIHDIREDMAAEEGISDLTVSQPSA